MVLWGFGRGRARLNPSPAGWHRGEEEVTAPQHAAHKAESSEGEEGEKSRAAARGGEHVRRLASHTPKHPASFEADYQKKPWVNS